MTFYAVATEKCLPNSKSTTPQKKNMLNPSSQSPATSSLIFRTNQIISNIKLSLLY